MEITDLKCIFIPLIFSEVYPYELECPSNQNRQLRANTFCQYATNYSCLFNVVSGVNVEECQKPETIGIGNKIIFNLKPELTNVDCPIDRFQPFNFWTNESTDCNYRKSFCSEEGQVLVGNGTSISDATCRCDYTRGYTYVTVPGNVCSCVPSEEDCSCYKENCTLSQDYNCQDNQRYQPDSKVTHCKALFSSQINQSVQYDPNLEVVSSPRGTEYKGPAIITYTRIAFIHVTMISVLSFIICTLGLIFEPAVSRTIIRMKDCFNKEDTPQPQGISQQNRTEDTNENEEPVVDTSSQLCTKHEDEAETHVNEEPMIDAISQLSSHHQEKAEALDVSQPDSTHEEWKGHKQPIPDNCILSIASKLGNELIQLAVHLGLKYEQIKTIKLDHPNDTYNQIIDALFRWRNQKHDNSVQRLFDALMFVERKDIIDDVSEEYDIFVGITHTKTSTQ